MLTSLLFFVVVPQTALEESPYCLKIRSLIPLKVLLKSYLDFRVPTLAAYL